jgi:tetratricopeptide (TPR) repeat protein
MSEPSDPIPKLTPEQRQTVAKLATRAKQVLASGNLDYAITLLLDCCKRDPASVPFRQELRKTEKLKYKDNKKGKPLAFLTTWRPGFKMETYAKTGKHLKAIEFAEEVLRSNPWHQRALVVSAQSFYALGLKDLAVWSYDQARQIDGKNATINRAMALLFEERGEFQKAIILWRLVAEALPKDKEAAKKATQLAASDTIQKGKYDQASSGEAQTPAVKEQLASARPTADNNGDASANLAEQRMAKDVAVGLKRIEENPTNAGGYLQLAQLYRRNDFLDKAREILKKGLTVTANNFDLSLESLDIEIEPFRRDLAACKEKLAAEPKNAELTALHNKLLKEIDTRELAYFRQKSDRFPTDAVARFEMAVRLYKVGQFDAAIEELQKVRTDPKHKTRVMIYLGMCFKAKKNAKLAQRNFEEAMQALSPAEESFRKEIMFQLATLYAENGEAPRAIELGCELANLDYGYKNIGALIEKWQSKK